MALMNNTSTARLWKHVLANLTEKVDREELKNTIETAIDNITIEVDPTLSVEGQAADAKAVSDAIANIEIELDKTLTIENQAADAKAVGDLINEKTATMTVEEINILCDGIVYDESEVVF